MTSASTEQEEDTGPVTGFVDIKGRDVEIRKLNDAQLSLMAREARLLERDSTPKQRKIDAVARMFSVLESVVIAPADKEYMDDLIVAGELDLKEMTTFVTAFLEEDQATKKVAPKVRRGRTTVKRA